MLIRKPGPLYEARRVLLLSLLLIILVALASPAGVLAQTATPAADLRIAQATLQLWPEYDDPGLLVIYSGTFSGAAAFPQQVSFPIAPGARGIQATYQDPSGRLMNEDFEVVDNRLVYTLPGASFHIEYYVDRPASGDQRDLTYTFQSSYPVDQLSIAVKEPARAGGFAVTPAATPSGAQQDGLKVYTLQQTNLAAGQSVPVTIRYSKPDQNPSVQRSEAPPGATAVPTGPVTGGSASTAISPLPYILIGVGLAVLAGALVYWLLERRRPAPAPNRPVRRPERAGKAGRPTGASAGATSTARAAGEFCARCGRRFRPDDQFCGQCGAPRK